MEVKEPNERPPECVDAGVVPKERGAVDVVFNILEVGVVPNERPVAGTEVVVVV